LELDCVIYFVILNGNNLAWDINTSYKGAYLWAGHKPQNSCSSFFILFDRATLLRIISKS